MYMQKIRSLNLIIQVIIKCSQLQQMEHTKYNYGEHKVVHRAKIM